MPTHNVRCECCGMTMEDAIKDFHRKQREIVRLIIKEQHERGD